MTRTAELLYDDRSDPNDTGWIVRISPSEPGAYDGWDEILGTSDPDDEDGARAEAERYLNNQRFDWTWQ